MPRSLVPLVLALGACAPEIDLSRPEDAPTASILSPSDRSELRSGRVELLGRVDDDQTSTEHVFAVWSVGNEASDADASWRDVCDGFAEADGTTRCTTDVGAGDTRIRLLAKDLAGFEKRVFVDVSVRAVEAPVVTIEAPVGDHVLYAGVPIRVRARISDADHAPDALAIAWEDSVLGPVDGPTHPDAQGVVEGTLDLPAGSHRLTVTATDPDGAEGVDALDLSVVTTGRPQVSLASRTPEGAVAVGEPLTLAAVALDGDDDPADLVATWTSDLDGPLAAPAVGAFGRVDADVVLATKGRHTLTLTVVDPVDAAGTTTVGVTAGVRPTLRWDAPDGGDVVAGSVALSGVAWDDETPPEDLEVTGSARGAASVTVRPEPTGAFSVPMWGLPPGTREVTVTVRDALGLTTSEVRTVDVE